MHSQLLSSILQQNTSGIPVKEFLQQLVKEYPYFTPGHFFLLQQLEEQDAAYTEQAAKTALMFNNPHWLHFKLLQTAAAHPAPVVPMYAENSDNDDDNAVIIHDGDTAAPAASAIHAAAIAETNAPDEEAVSQENDNDDDNAVLMAPAANDVIAEPSLETIAGAPEERATTVHGQETAGSNAVTPAEDDTNNTEPMPNIKIALKAPLTGETGDSQLSFEPMHLVDYFASQGIKLSEELQTGDKLGKQLRSFTEWLKTMKKVHSAGAAGATSSSEVAIQALAEKSNTENEILTEAMAQVFTQQGKTAKAIELYEKLSLLNPAKSAYFAAQIDKLKG